MGTEDALEGVEGTIALGGMQEVGTSPALALEERDIPVSRGSWCTWEPLGRCLKPGGSAWGWRRCVNRVAGQDGAGRLRHEGVCACMEVGQGQEW